MENDGVFELIGRLRKGFGGVIYNLIESQDCKVLGYEFNDGVQFVYSCINVNICKIQFGNWCINNLFRAKFV